MTVVDCKATRTIRSKLIRQKSLITGNELLVQTLNSMSIYVLILNDQREIVFVNDELSKAIGIQDEDYLGCRPGELLKCKFSTRSALGCGHAEECEWCDVKNIIVDVIHHNNRVKKDVSIVSEINGIEITSSFEETVSRIDVDDEALYMVAFVDRSSEVTKSNLERVFYHDILNSATSVFNVIRLLKMENQKFREDKDIADIQGYIQNIIEEIEFQRSISFAEKDDLDMECTLIDIRATVCDIVARMNTDQRYRHADIVVEDAIDEPIIHSSKVLIRRILTNLLKNALEANRSHTAVGVKIETSESSLHIYISNAEVIPDEKKRFIFEKGYSSKGKGRGFGTYGSKLLLNKYLSGELTFESNDKIGTVFKMSLPREVNDENFNS